MDWFLLFYTFLGGLGLFFYGMRILSDSLQALAGSVIRRVINALTSNRLLAVGIGAFVTTLVQSSSITTVMVVGFVNAGLMDLTQAIGVIFGANIGTTITGWIIAIKVGKYGLLLVGLGIIPIMLPLKPRFKNMGQLLLALGLIFMGLKFMSSAFKPLRSAEGFLELMQYFSADSYATLFACILMGTILTFVIQSSSAMLAITIALAMSGAITFQTGAALVIGENIGTTITAWLASLGMNTSAKRAARAHAIFNIVGALWLSIIFWHFLDFIDWLVVGEPDALAADGSKPFVATHIAAGHTAFNIANTIVFLPFLRQLSRFVIWITPAKEEAEIPHLEFLPGMTPNLAITAAQKQLLILAGITQRSLRRTHEYTLSDSPSHKVAKQINHYEDVADNMQSEITHFLSRVQESSMSQEATELSFAIMRAADELESITDYAASIVRYRDRLQNERQNFSAEALQDLQNYFEATNCLFDDIYKQMQDTPKEWLLEPFLERNSQLIDEANRMRKAHMQRLEKKICNPSAGMVYADTVVALRKMRGHVINIVEALAGDKTDSTT